MNLLANRFLIIIAAILFAKHNCITHIHGYFQTKKIAVLHSNITSHQQR